MENSNISTSLNVLGASLIVAKQNAHMIHWNYKDKDFITVHTWLDEVIDQYAGHIDTVYEKIRMIGGVTLGSLENVIKISKVTSIDISTSISHDDAFQKLYEDIEMLRKLVDGNATLGEENKLFTYHDGMVGICKDLDKLRYFITSSL